MTDVHVPDLPGPQATLCWAQSPLLVRCDRKHGHAGPHSWAWAAAVEQAERDYNTQAVERFAWQSVAGHTIDRLEADLAALRERHAAAVAELEVLRGKA